MLCIGCRHRRVAAAVTCACTGRCDDDATISTANVCGRGAVANHGVVDYENCVHFNRNTIYINRLSKCKYVDVLISGTTRT